MDHSICASALLVTAVAVSAIPANAAIKCRGEFQLVQGSEISTPFCADNYLGKVAREYGIKVSDVEIRNNPNTKNDVCRFVGHDNRVRQNCINQQSGRRGF